jgi:hypothetical protein
MAFDGAAVQAVFAAIQSAAQGLGVFERVYTHEPKSAPGAGLSFACWWDSLDPYPAGSGLSAVSGRVQFSARLYRAYMAKPEDLIDPVLLSAVCSFLAALSGAFSLGGTVRNADLLGESGSALSAQAAYLEMDGKPYRVADITIPVIINDLWTEAP